MKDFSDIKSYPLIIECFHLTSRRPCWCPKPILWELNSFLMQTLSFVPINLHRCWPREWKHSIFLHTHVNRKNLREPSSNQIKSNIYYVTIRERKRQRLSLSLPTVEPHFLLDMDTLTLQTVFFIPGSKLACQLTWTPINADRHIGSII